MHLDKSQFVRLSLDYSVEMLRLLHHSGYDLHYSHELGEYVFGPGCFSSNVVCIKMGNSAQIGPVSLSSSSLMHGALLSLYRDIKHKVTHLSSVIPNIVGELGDNIMNPDDCTVIIGEPGSSHVLSFNNEYMIPIQVAINEYHTHTAPIHRIEEVIKEITQNHNLVPILCPVQQITPPHPHIKSNEVFAIELIEALSNYLAKIDNRIVIDLHDMAVYVPNDTYTLSNI